MLQGQCSEAGLLGMNHHTGGDCILTCACMQVYIRVDEQCKTLCKIDSLTANQAKAFKGKIEDDYRVLM